MGLSPRRAALALACAVLPGAVMAPGLAHAAFECPVAAPAATKPLPGDLGQSLKPYDDPRADPALKADIAAMKAEGMPNGEVVDHVVAAYCPVVAAVPKLTDADKDGLVQRFASHLVQVVYAPAHGTVEDIIVDVPVPTDLYSRITEAAEQHKQTRDAFVLAALRKAAGTP
ncbi:hypothetical protein [Lichenibacterium dinghuense]|uniref:hypothetical protein n=1 Tax=Lichenibacterium dinghuense TaxID=2895977 RepID=UPI001F4637B3|nr:hypothetical protein [Lichenibacterium sp. 6Y81]